MLRRMIGEIKVPRDLITYVFVVFLYAKKARNRSPGRLPVLSI